MKKFFAILFITLPVFLNAQKGGAPDNGWVAGNYNKIEIMIPMRDGVKLFTAIYIPKESGERYPIMMERTPYSCYPYGEQKMRSSLGPNPILMHEKYIFVYQDVRGRYKSEGSFEEMTPAIDNKKGLTQTDESSDTYDAIEWLLKNIPQNNGKVGIYGISYPGFYASASLPNAHPAIKAVSPQAPVTDEFIGDDANHNGAFFLLDNFDFTNYFQGTRTEDGTNYKPVFSKDYKDAYAFFKTLEPLSKTNSVDYFGKKAKIWNEYLEHTTYDKYWKERNIRPHLKNIKPAVLVVGGWFDAEDMFGAMRTYEAIEKQNPGNDNRIVLGPWTHGAWSAPHWDHFGTHQFGQDLNKFFQEELETRFFDYYLKGIGKFEASEATVFETGSNEWKHYNSWPPENAEPNIYFLQASKKLTKEVPHTTTGYDEYVSDPANPVPYTKGIFERRNNEYMVEDQRFASERPDVLVYQSDILDQDITVTGRIKTNLYVSTTGTDADIVVKIIDVLPEGELGASGSSKGSAAGFQRLVRADVFRCKFRNSFESPSPMVPGQATKVSFDLNEIDHRFKKGHRIMVQVQSSWFPLVDLNPQKFVNIPTCLPSDFQKAKIRIYHDTLHPSSITLPILK